MAVIEVVRGDGLRASRHLSIRLAWLAAIWIVSTAAFFVAASLLHLLVPK
ncbi:DUF2474 family protein [Acetobacter musti]|uniref:DUF2474 family protein n=1 Tax=Acetobacter musti TaxID=864732 RepID=A0ABX0JWH2_9PROT|nr:DUF2474 family protein [Acetobacter musti]NHN86330.1 DUF2474 family protein [Acetobacter musti]